MISISPPAIIVMIISSPIPVIPSPMAANQPNKSYVPVKTPTTPLNTNPSTKTTMTFTPTTAVTSTTK